MAFTHGKDSYFAIDQTSGSASPTNVSSYVDTVDGLPGDVEMADVTVYGDEGHKQIPGLQNVTITVAGNWDSTLDGYLAPARSETATRTFHFGPAGSGSGAVQYNGECWVSNYTVSAPVAGKVTWSATLMVNGVVNRTSF